MVLKSEDKMKYKNEKDKKDIPEECETMNKKGAKKSTSDRLRYLANNSKDSTTKRELENLAERVDNIEEPNWPKYALDLLLQRIDNLKSEVEKENYDKFQGWQRLSTIKTNINPHESGRIMVVPTVSPYFEAKRVYMKTFRHGDHTLTAQTSILIGSATVGGSPQLAINTLSPSLFGPKNKRIESIIEALKSTNADKKDLEYLERMALDDRNLLGSSDFYREGQFVNWSVFSTRGLARELMITYLNPNEYPVDFIVEIEGNSVPSLDCYG